MFSYRINNFIIESILLHLMLIILKAQHLLMPTTGAFIIFISNKPFTIHASHESHLFMTYEINKSIEINITRQNDRTTKLCRLYGRISYVCMSSFDTFVSITQHKPPKILPTSMSIKNLINCRQYQKKK